MRVSAYPFLPFRSYLPLFNLPKYFLLSRAGRPGQLIGEGSTGWPFAFFNSYIFTVYISVKSSWLSYLLFTIYFPVKKNLDHIYLLLPATFSPLTFLPFTFFFISFVSGHLLFHQLPFYHLHSHQLFFYQLVFYQWLSHHLLFYQLLSHHLPLFHVLFLS
jgi:hypothetical protein